MADLPELPEWTSGIYQLETSDPVLGGPEGIDNLQAKQLANRTKWLKDKIDQLDAKQSVLAATTANIVLNALQTVDGVALTAGDRVLVKDQAAGKDNGIYIAATGAWTRAADADDSTEVTPGLVIAVEQGTTLADTRWQLVTDGAIVLGTTALTFQNVTKGFAPLSSPAFVDNPTAPTKAQFDNSSALMTTAFAKRMGVEFSGFNSINASTVLTNSSVGGIVSAAAAGAINVTLPPTAGVPHGAAILLTNAGTSAVTLLGSGTDLTTNQSGATISIVLGLGDSAWLVKVTGEWRLVAGSYALKYSALMPALVSGFFGVQRFSANGSFTVPDGITKIHVTASGGGGGGGGGYTANYSGEGGGGAAFLLRAPYAVTPGQVLAITVGGGGVAGAISGAGGAGGATSVGALVTLAGGSGGAPGTSGSGGSGAGFGAGSGLPGADAFGSVPGMGGASLGPGGTARVSIGVQGVFGGGGSGGYINYSGGAGAAGIVIIEW